MNLSQSSLDVSRYTWRFWQIVPCLQIDKHAATLAGVKKLTCQNRLGSLATCDLGFWPKQRSEKRIHSLIRILAGPSSSKGDSSVGSNTLRHMCLRVCSETFFFLFKFCAIDSVHLTTSHEHERRRNKQSKRAPFERAVKFFEVNTSGSSRPFFVSLTCVASRRLAFSNVVFLHGLRKLLVPRRTRHERPWLCSTELALVPWLNASYSVSFTRCCNLRWIKQRQSNKAQSRGT